MSLNAAELYMKILRLLVDKHLDLARDEVRSVRPSLGLSVRPSVAL